MSNRRLVRPTYPENFRCIGSACEDTCCHGWSVPIEKAVYEKYQSLPSSPLRTLIDASVLLAPKNVASSEGFGPEAFAKIRMNGSNTCPMLSSDHLCRIHAECGESFLSHACATYPRIIHSVGGTEEKALAFSCPEAVREGMLKRIVWKRVDPASIETHDDATSVPRSYWPIRATVLETVRNRAYPLWQRLLLLGMLCQKLDAMWTAEADAGIGKFLEEFSETVVSGNLRAAIAGLPLELETQVDAVLRLAGLMLHKSNVTPRFVSCIHAFASGIGNGPHATLASLTAGYTAAHDRYFVPFFERYPHILENYVVNTILRCQFPFGREGMKPGAVPAMAQEFTKLVAQFALMRGLLIGAAGFHGSNFADEHIVHTVQAASKHFDHHPEFPRLSYELLVESRLDGLQGAAILLNHPAAAQRKSTPVRRKLPQPAITQEELVQISV